MSSTPHKHKAPPQNFKAPLLKTFWRRFCVALPPGAAVRTPSSLIQSSTPHYELWLDSFVLHQQTIFLSPRESNLLSFVAEEQHSLLHVALWGMDTYSGIHQSTWWDTAAVKIETAFFSAAQKLIGPIDNSVAHWAAKCRTRSGGSNTRLGDFIPDVINCLSVSAWVRLNYLCTGVGRFTFIMYTKIGCISGLRVIRRGKTRRPYCPGVSLKPTSYWGEWSGGCR